MGLGSLASPGAAAVVDSTVTYGSYMDASFLFSPAEPGTGVTSMQMEYHKLLPWFGETWRQWTAGEWSDAGSPNIDLPWSMTYGTSEMMASYVYRHGDRSIWDGTNAADMAPWTVDRNLRYTNTDNPGYSSRSVIANGGSKGNGGPAYADMWRQSEYVMIDGGTNAGFGDGSGVYVRHDDFANNEFNITRGNPDNNGPYEDVDPAIFGDSNHWLYPNLLMAAVDFYTERQP